MLGWNSFSNIRGVACDPADAEVAFVMDVIEMTVANFQDIGEDYRYDREVGELVFWK